MTYLETLRVLFSGLIGLVSDKTTGLVYHLVLLFAFQAAAAIAFGQWRKGAAEGRLFWAAAALFTVRLGLLGVSLAVAAGLTPEYAILPPVDRAASTLTILLILWAFNFPKPARLADALTAAGVLFTLVALGISLALWLQAVPPLGTVAAYNGSAQESVWESAQLGVLFVGAVLLLVRRKPEWLIGVGMTLLLLVVHGLQLALPLSGNVPGLVRVIEIVALPMFTALVYRRSHRLADAAAAPISAPIQLTTPTALSPSAVNSRALLAMASLSAAVELDERRQNVTMALTHLFQADVGLLILPPDKSGSAPVACCYRAARGEFAVRPDVPVREFPAVAAALGEGRSALLAFEANEVELRRLVAGTGLESIGQGLMAPMAMSKDYPQGTIVLIAAAARPAWTGDDERLLVSLTRALAGGFDAVEQMAAMRREAAVQQTRADQTEAQRQVVQESAEKLMTELAAAQSAVLQLTGQLEMTQRLSVAEGDGATQAAQAEELAEMRAELEQMRRHAEERNRLEVEMEAAQEGVAALQLLQGQFEALSTEAEALRAANARLQSEMEHLTADLRAAEAQSQQAGAPGLAAEREAESQHTAKLRLELEMARMELQQSAAPGQLPSGGETQSQSTTQFRLELEMARMELQKAAEREAGMLEQFEQDRQALGQETQAAVEAVKAEVAEKVAAWQQAAERQTALEQAVKDAQASAQEAQAALAAAQAALAEKTLSLEQASEQGRRREAELAAQLAERTEEVERVRARGQQAAERQGTLEQAEKDAQGQVQAVQVTLAAMQAELAEKNLGLQQSAEGGQQREAELTAELERVRAAWQQAVERQTALEQAEKDAQAQVQAAQAALVEKTQGLQQAAEERQQREAELTAQLAQRAGELERAKSDWQQAAERQAALDQALQTQQAKLQAAQDAQEALNLARATIAGQAAAVVSVQQKLSETERELAETAAALEAARQAELPPLAQSALDKVAALAQDLRQPVMSISGYVSLLLGESVGLVGAVQKKFLERIQASCERLETLLNDLTVITDAAVIRMPLTLASVDVAQLVETVLQDSEALVREKGIHLRMELDENLPVLQADPKVLHQVLSGLLHNAASASALNGEVGLSVRRETQTTKEDGPSDCLFISVRDSGAGIAPEDLPKVFAGRASPEAPIAGLGDAGRELAALRPLVEAHRGRLWAVSEPGKGSTFSLLLPVTADSTAKPVAAEPQPGPLGEPSLPVPKTPDFVVLPPD